MIHGRGQARGGIEDWDLLHCFSRCSCYQRSFSSAHVRDLHGDNSHLPGAHVPEVYL